MCSRVRCTFARCPCRFAEDHFDAHRALTGKRVELPFSQVTRELMEKAGLEPSH